MKNTFLSTSLIESNTSLINIKDFGAKGDGRKDDTRSINNAFAYAEKYGLTVFVPSGKYIVSNLIFGSQNESGQSSSPLGIIGEGNSSILFAKSGTTGVMLSACSIAGVVFSGFLVDGNSQTVICIDTSWLPSAGPSTQNHFENIWVQRYNGYSGWKCKNNNDSIFLKCAVRMNGEDSVYSFDAPNQGGMITFDQCYWYSKPLGVCGQNINIWGCGGLGVKVNGADMNSFDVSGSYLYSHEDIGCIVDASDYPIRQIIAYNSHLDIREPDHEGFKGEFLTGVTVKGGNVIRSAASGSPLFFSPSMVNASGNYRAVLKLDSCVVDNITISNPDVLKFHLDCINTSGVNASDEPISQITIGRDIYSRLSRNKLELGNLRGIGHVTQYFTVIDAAPSVWASVGESAIIKGAALVMVSSHQDAVPSAIFLCAGSAVTSGTKSVQRLSYEDGSGAYAGCSIAAQWLSGDPYALQIRLTGGALNAYLKISVIYL